MFGAVSSLGACGMVAICHLNLAPHYRGGERQTELLIRELAARDIAQRLVIKRGNTLKDRCSGIAGLQIREVSPNPLAAGLAVRGAGIAHAHDGRTVYSALYANLLHGTPYILTRRVVAPQAASWFRALAYRRARAVAAVSTAAAAELSKRQPGIDPVVIPDAVAGFVPDRQEVARIRARYPGKRLLGHIGALDHSHKGQSTIIEVARRVQQSHPDWHFLLCGDGRDEARFRREIGALQNIELLGWIDNVGDYLAAFDVFVYPSLHEAMGSTLLDAMQMGLPVIATNVGGIPGFVKDGANGLLVEPQNPAQLLQAVDRALTDKHWRSEVGTRNQKTAAEYGVSRMADDYLRLYRI